VLLVGNTLGVKSKVVTGSIAGLVTVPIVLGTECRWLQRGGHSGCSRAEALPQPCPRPCCLIPCAHACPLISCNWRWWRTTHQT
jgi:hypothetical protein